MIVSSCILVDLGAAAAISFPSQMAVCPFLHWQAAPLYFCSMHQATLCRSFCYKELANGIRSRTLCALVCGGGGGGSEVLQCRGDNPIVLHKFCILRECTLTGLGCAGWLETHNGEQCVVCPYHGWAFDSQGVCQLVPAAENMLDRPKQSIADVMPVQEKVQRAAVGPDSSLSVSACSAECLSMPVPDCIQWLFPKLFHHAQTKVLFQTFNARFQIQSFCDVLCHALVECVPPGRPSDNCQQLASLNSILLCRVALCGSSTVIRTCQQMSAPTFPLSQNWSIPSGGQCMGRSSSTVHTGACLRTPSTWPTSTTCTTTPSATRSSLRSGT